MPRIRLLSQILFFLLFLFLFARTDYSGEPQINAAVKFFLEADPLVAVVVLLENKWIPKELTRLFVLAGSVLLFTVLLGRFFCGWICPLGAVHHLAGYRRRLTRDVIDKGVYHASQYYKYLLLVVVLVLSLFSLQIAGVVDPISILIRSLTISVIPAMHWTALTISTYFLDHELPIITPISEFLYGSLKKNDSAF